MAEKEWSFLLSELGRPGLRSLKNELCSVVNTKKRQDPFNLKKIRIGKRYS